MGGDGFAVADGVAAFVGSGFDVDLGGVYLEQAGEVGSHLGFEGLEPGLLGDDQHVDIANRVAGGGNELHGVFDEERGGGAFEAGVGVGEVLADVAGADGAEEGINRGVEDDIAVGVGDGAELVGDLYAGEDEVADGSELVKVEAVADAIGQAGVAHRGNSLPQSVGKGKCSCEVGPRGRSQSLGHNGLVGRAAKGDNLAVGLGRQMVE